jgi:L-rhamnose mutarotase
MQRFGSLIRLKPEFEKRYIILHKHTFPGVLKRIHNSNIRNYSIFLRDRMLFSYYEYHGKDYEGDMQKIGEDSITQEWWKLTDPMQEPIEDRKEGEWWASMGEVDHFSGNEFSSDSTRRLAYRTKEKSISVKKLDVPEDIVNEGYIHKLSVFHTKGRLYLYCEYEETSTLSPVASEEKAIETILSQINFDDQLFQWERMEEIFHTD